jgi:predicted DNA-binding transcriptional regulator YafY
VGQRSSTETAIALIQAFLEQRVWTQAELARRLEISVPAVKKRLDEMTAAGFPLESEKDHPHVYWSVPKDWFPGGLLIKRDEVPDLLRQLGRLPRSKARDKMLDVIIGRIPQQAASGPSSVVAPRVSAREEQHLAVIEDSARAHTALRFRYYTASRGTETVRHASVHAVFPAPPARFVATCHRTELLRWFRVENVSDAALDSSERYRPATETAVDSFLSESIDGYREEVASETVAFFVREPESRWVSRNLPSGMNAEVENGGIRVTVQTSALLLVARYVVQLGDAARAETPTLAAKVAEIAQGALRNAVPSE